MKPTHIMVELEKMVSDGNYGRERVVVQFAVDLDEGEDAQHATILLLNQARNRLNEQLGKSESLSVRRAINPPPNLCRMCRLPLSDNEDYEHEACAKARYKRDTPLVAVGAVSDGDDGDGHDDEPDIPF